MADLNGLPTKNGFRQRGMDMTRTETFTDAAFAFAVTLLVISIDAIPSNFDELIRVISGIPAFAMSLLLLMVFWLGHWTWSRRYGLEDMPSIILSVTLVGMVLCYVYPLKMLGSGFVAWVSSGRIHGGFSVNNAGELAGLFIVYGAGFVAMNIVIILLNVHAWRQRDALELNELERFDTVTEIRAWAIVTSVGVISILVAIVFPNSAPYGLPGFAYMLLAFAMPIHGARRNKERKQLLARMT